MKNAISWFEIPSSDLNRATKFYETVFGIKLNPLDLPNIKMRMFHGNYNESGGNFSGTLNLSSISDSLKGRVTGG